MRKISNSKANFLKNVYKKMFQISMESHCRFHTLMPFKALKLFLIIFVFQSTVWCNYSSVNFFLSSYDEALHGKHNELMNIKEAFRISTIQRIQELTKKKFNIKVG